MPHPLPALLLAALLAAGCARSPLGRSQLILFSDGEVAAAGLAAYQQMKQQVPISKDLEATRYVQCVGGAITRELGSGAGSWEITLFEDPSANAFALPGGKIGVHTGLLEVAHNQDQLATVLGHEVAHVIARHSNERLSTATGAQIGLAGLDAVLGSIANVSSVNHQVIMGALGLGTQVGVLLPYGRTQESEADIIGLDLMARAGFDPRESVALWKNMMRAGGAQPPEFLSTHPSHEDRIDGLYDHMGPALQASEQARAAGRQPDCQ